MKVDFKFLLEHSSKPELLFTQLALPIHTINNIRQSGSVASRDRKFHYEGGEYFSPEIVAVVHFTREGHDAVWSEGLAPELVSDSIERYFSKALVAHFVTKPPVQPDLDFATHRDRYVQFLRAHAALTDGLVDATRFPVEDLLKRSECIAAIRLPRNGIEEMRQAYSAIAGQIDDAFGDSLDEIAELKPRRAEFKNSSNAKNLATKITNESEAIRNGQLPVGILNSCHSGSVESIADSISRLAGSKSTISPEDILMEYQKALNALRNDREILKELLVGVIVLFVHVWTRRLLQAFFGDRKRFACMYPAC